MNKIHNVHNFLGEYTCIVINNNIRQIHMSNYPI